MHDTELCVAASSYPPAYMKNYWTVIIKIDKHFQSRAALCYYM